MIFRKWERGVKGRLELFWKFIRFGRGMRPLSPFHKTNQFYILFHLTCVGDFPPACTPAQSWYFAFQWIYPYLLRQFGGKDKDCGGTTRQVKPYQFTISRLVNEWVTMEKVPCTGSPNPVLIVSNGGAGVLRWPQWVHLQVVPDPGRLTWVPSNPWSLIAKSVSWCVNCWYHLTRPSQPQRKESYATGILAALYT